MPIDLDHINVWLLETEGGHVLVDDQGRMYGVDHGVCFHREEKLRTVLWGWAGERLTEPCREVLHLLETSLQGDLGDDLGELLSRGELTMVGRRVERLLRSGLFPSPSAGWPAIPWPAF